MTKKAPPPRAVANSPYGNFQVDFAPVCTAPQSTADFEKCIVVRATGIIIAVLLTFAWKYKKLKHQATWIGVFINLTTLFHEAIGSNESVQDFLKSMILYRP